MNRPRFLRISLLILLVAGLLLLSACAKKELPALGVELLINGSFEDSSDQVKPSGWLTDAYIEYSDVSSFEWVSGRSGKAIQINNHQLNDARYYQTIKVEPNTIYLFSGYVKTSAQGGLGANLSIKDVYAFSTSVYDSQEAWQYIEFYGRTGKNQREVTLYARLGGYSGEASGYAAFDDLSLKALAAAPEGATVHSWEKAATQAQTSPKTEGAAKPATAPLFLAMLLGIVLMLFFAKKAEQHLELSQKDDAKWPYMLAALLLISLIFRLIIAIKVPGFPVDIGAFTAWANRMAELGPSGFYSSNYFADYPPGYMLVLWVLGLLGQLFGTGTTALMVKLPAILADLAIIAVLFQVARKQVGAKSALLLASLYAFSPLPYLSGAAWGQVDSLPALLLVLSVLMILDGKWRYALPVFTLGVLMKPQALMVGPLGLLALVLYLVWARWDKAALKDAGMGMIASVLLILVIALPFINEENGVFYLFGLYGNTMSGYAFATVNATNLYFLFGLNWVSIKEAAPFLLRLLGLLSLLLPCGIYVLREHHKSSKSGNKADKSLYIAAFALLPAVIGLLPFDLQFTGILLMLSVFLFIGWMLYRSGDLARLPLLAGIMLTGFSVLGTMMHERYIFLAIVLLTLAYLQKRDRRILYLLIGLSILCFFNTGIALDRSLRIGGGQGNLHAPAAMLSSDTAWLEYLLSAFSLVLTAAAVYLGFALSPAQAETRHLPNIKAQKKELKETIEMAFQKKEQTRFDRWDALIIMGVTLVFALLSFINLGSNKAPSKPWISTEDSRQLVLDLGEERSFHLAFFGGIHWYDVPFDISTSQDGERWESYQGVMKPGDCFAWRYLSYPRGEVIGFHNNPYFLQGRYVKLNVPEGRMELMELIAIDSLSRENIPFVSVDKGGEALIDEQDSMQGGPDWSNSMYFDEIFHARTAFEMRNGLQGLEPSTIYETTHPPLGKFFMTLSIMVFGMNPFGWRFAGALAGVLMLPGLYLLGKQFTKKRWLGLFAMLMMAFDFMRFTQTRIATIDSFVTLFIIYAYFFMFRYMGLDHVRASLRQKLVPLMLSGLMMGLAVASKWPGIYAGIGLAILFFWSLIRNMIIGQKAKALSKHELAALGDQEEALVSWGQRSLKDSLITCLWCILFFILIPGLIYYLSYIPVLAHTPGGLSIQRVIDNNINMFNYHSQPGFGADHDFSSPWYSWPVIGKPMYFYAGGTREGTASTILSFGNPAVWWTGLLALFLVFAIVLLQVLKKAGFAEKSSLMGLNLDRDPRPLMLLLAFAAQYVPWMLVPRGTYIYHYFPSVPFIILCITLLLDYLAKRYQKTAKILGLALLVLAAALFIAFFPYLSGVRVWVSWLQAMKWFPNWLYY